MVFGGWGYEDANGDIVPFDFDTPIDDDITLYAIWENEAVEIIPLNPDESSALDGGFTILRGKWANETTTDLKFAVRINGKTDEALIKARIDNFTLNVAASNGFSVAHTSYLTANTAISASNVSDTVVEMQGGQEYRIIVLKVTDTLKSGIVDFTLNYTALDNTVTATGLNRVLIPADTNRDNSVNTVELSQIYAYMKAHTPIPLKMRTEGFDAYAYELADVDKSDAIDTADYSVIYNMMKNFVVPN